MLILAVELENVKSYDKIRVEFLPGVNAIVGHNGAGKSTLLEAIGFVLFDSLEYKQTEFIRAGANSATAVVTFVSSYDDRPYQVVRRIGSGAQYYVFDAELDARVCDGKADVQRFLRRHMGVEENTDLAALFHDAVGVPQGLLTSVFLQKESARGDIFDSLLKVRDYERAWEKLRDTVSWLKEQRSGLTSDISGMQGRLERLPDLKLAVSERDVSIAAAQRDFASAAAELVQVQEQRAGLESVRAELTRFGELLSQAMLRHTELKARLASAERLQSDAEEAACIVAQHSAGAGRYRAAEAEQRELEKLQRQRREMETTRTAADKAVALVDSELRVVEQQLEAVAQAETAAAALAPAVAEQTALEQSLAEARQQQARLDDARRAAAQAESQVTRQQRSLAKLEQNHGRVTAVESARSEAEKNLADLRSQIDRSLEQMGLYKSQAETLKEQTARLEDVSTAFCPVCEQPLTDGHRLDLLKRNAERVQEMRERYRAVQNEIKQHENERSVHEGRVKEFQAELLQLPRAQEVESARADLEHAQAVHAAAVAQVEQLSLAPGQVEALAQQLAALNDPKRRHAVAVEQAAQRIGVEQKQTDLARQRQKEHAALEQALAALVKFAGLDEQVDAVAAELERHYAANQAVLKNQQLAETLTARKIETAALADDLERQTAEVTRLEAERRTIADRFDEPRYNELTVRGSALQEQIGGLKNRLDMLQVEQEREQNEIAALQEVETSLKEAQSRLRKLDEQTTVLEAIRSTLRQAGPSMREALIRQVSDGAHQIFGEIMQDFSRRLVWNKDYSISLEVDGHMRQFLQLSGGEQMTAALAVRLALLREISNINVAFFDEPTANLDEVRREALARQILSVRGFSQIFVISHDDTFEQATQNLVRVTRQNGVSRVLEDANMA